MNIQDIATQLLYTTVPILVSKRDGSISTATGFIFSVVESEQSSIPLLITNYHVLEGAAQGFIELHIGNNGIPSDKTVRVDFDQSIAESNKLGQLDLVAIPIASAVNDLQTKGIELFYRSIDQSIIPDADIINEFSAIESVTFIGYPSSIYDQHNKMPIIRQGITATPIWNNFGGEECFLIDAGVFPGSSGSPVFIYNQGAYPTANGISVGSRLFFVGIITQTLSRDEPNRKDYLNLGKVINSKAFYTELEQYVNKIKGVN